MLVAAPARDRDVPANSIFSDPIASTLSAIRCDESPSTCQCEKENKKAERFQISHFYWSFRSDIISGISEGVSNNGNSHNPRYRVS